MLHLPQKSYSLSINSARKINTREEHYAKYTEQNAHFRVAFYCGQPKAHMCNNHAV